MDFDYQQKTSTRKLVGIGAVILLHVLIVYGLVSGLARKAVEIVKKPIQVALIEEIKPPPPPPPPTLPPSATPSRPRPWPPACRQRR